MRRSPAATSAPMALASAHWVIGYAAFSTLHPAYRRSLSARTQTPTRNREYGAYALASAWRASSSICSTGGPDMAPRPPTLGRAPAKPWRASKSPPDSSSLLHVGNADGSRRHRATHDSGEQRHREDVRDRLDELHRYDAHERQRRPLQAKLDRVGEGEQQARAQRRQRAPLPEDQRGQREVAFAGRHITDEGRVVSRRQIRAREPAQDAAAHERHIARGRDRHPGGVDRARALADRSESQPEARPVDEPRDDRDGGGGDVDQEIVAADHLAVDRADHGQGRERCRAG